MLQLLKRTICFFATILIFSFQQANGQEDDISFLIRTIKSSYAGYGDKVKGTSFDNFAKQAISSSGTDTFRILSLLTGYFNDQHLKVAAFRNIPVDTVLLQNNFHDVQAYLARAESKKQYEGYWLNDYNNCVIALKRSNDAPLKYEAYVIESRNNALPNGLVCARLEQIGADSFLTEYTTSVSGKRIYQLTRFRSDSLFTVGMLAKWRRLNSYQGNLLASLPAFSEAASGGLEDKDNYVIHIPDNSEENTKIVDSLVKVDSAKIVSAKNLIIDIRNNLGGTVRTYASLFPFVYTKPINQISGYTYNSDEFLKAMERVLASYKQNDPNNAYKIKKMEDRVSKIKSDKGKVIMKKGEIYKSSTVLKFPQNVAIIANYACISAAEMMILDFKQSSKVTLFGEQTNGAVDYLDNFNVVLPSKKYVLNIASAKRIIPKGAGLIDGIGIKPDVVISDGVEDWVSFVKDYYAEKGK